jgi:dolichol-phosphate mannosyltransferase
VVLPTYNERDNLMAIVEAVQNQLPQAAIWIVDDQSPDGTGEIADSLAAADDRISVIHRSAKLGLGTAYVEAFQAAVTRDFDAVLQMDTDFSHDPGYLPALLDALRDADLVIGSRYVSGGGTQNWSRLRQTISRGGNWVARRGLGVRTRDATGGYRAFRRSTLEKLDFDSMHLRGYGFQIEVVFQVERLGLRIKEVPIVFVERRAGQSKMSQAIVLEAGVHILRRRFRQILRLETAPAEKTPSPALEER